MRFPRTALIPIAVAWCVLSPLTGHSDENDLYLIELQVLVATGQKVTMVAGNAVTSEELVSVGDVSHMTVGDMTVDLSAELMWAGQAKPPAGSGIELLTAPSLRVRANQAAAMRSGSTVQYLEQTKEGCYAVRTLPADISPGIFLDLVPGAGSKDERGVETVELDLKLRISTIGERAPVPGFQLDVGRPIVRSKETASRYRYRLGRWNLVTSYITREPEKETLLVLIRVTRPAA